jgi:CubicO group peptidase (beta-lactamase class C family)
MRNLKRAIAFMKRSNHYKWILSLISGILFLNTTYSQSFEWQKASPETEGFSAEKLQQMTDTLAKHNTTSILVIRNDRIVLEWYAPGWNADKKHYTASLAKALVGGMSLELALNDGRLNADDPACLYISEWKNDPQKSKITIRQLATHSSGIEDAELSDEDLLNASRKGIIIKDQHMDIPGWKGHFWRKDPDPFTIARDSAPVIFPPGTSYHYSNPGMAMLAYAVTASYKGTDYPDIRTLLAERIYRPIGIKNNDWDIGYGQTYKVSGLELVANWGGGSFTPRAVARIGRLMMNNGNWEGRQLIDAKWVKLVTQYAGTPLPPRDSKQPAPACGLAWYNNYDGIWENAPRDLFLGSGAGNQTLIVIPSLKMIIVRNGSDMFDARKGEGHFYGVVRYLVDKLMDAYMEPPYPQSKLITGVKFAPVSTIVRKASGSDNWPLTWADDDKMYTAYGDGWGFEPGTDKKLSLGFAEIEGAPGNFRGTNIRSVTGEQLGQGRFGKKASSILMVNNVLYLLVRNANKNGEESQLAWSSDHGKSWIFADWKFSEGLGYPVFLNFGKNYSGARDNFVYIFSHDEKDAYKPADQMVMGRVPKGKITERSAYEFFAGFNKNGDPQWSGNIADRSGVFINPGRCMRGSISYNRGLKRYLWCQVLPQSDDPQGPRFSGGFGIYEAPEPWGPWHTVFFTKKWDTGPGETSSLPTKWMSTDGKNCYLVFSGEDCFSVRKVEFTIR